MTLTAVQLRQADRLQKRGLLLREIAAELDVTFEDVCLGLYGNNDWGKRDGSLGRADAGPDAGPDDKRHSGAGDAGAAGTMAFAKPPHPASGHLLPRGEKATPASTSETQAAPSPVAAARPAAEPVAEPQPQGRAADAAPVVVDARAGAPVLAVRPRAAAAALEADKIYRLVEFDGQTLHQNRRSLTRLPQFFWRGTGEAVARLKRQMPQWQDLEPVETDIRPEGAR